MENEDDNIIDTSEKEVNGVKADKKIPVATSPSVSVEPTPASSANLNEEGRAIFQPINTSQIEMNNAEQDPSREKNGKCEDDGNNTDKVI